MVTSNHRCKGFMAATITATEMCGLSMTAELLGCLKRLKIKPIKPGFDPSNLGLRLCTTPGLQG